MTERQEAFMRIIIGIVSGIILGVWKALIQIVTIIHWIYVIFAGKRNKDFAKFCNYWNSFVYRYIRYMTFTTNARPFPFTSLGKNIESLDMKKKK